MSGWAKITFEDEATCRDFENAFFHLFITRDDQEHGAERQRVALYREDSEALVAYLSPVAADWMAEAVPRFGWRFIPCPRPNSAVVRMASAGDLMASDTAFVELPPEEMAAINAARMPDPDVLETMEAEFRNHLRLDFSARSDEVPF